MNRFLVTGANGYLGAELIRRLVERPENRVFGTFRNATDRLIEPAPKNLTYAQCDLSDPGEVKRLFATGTFTTILHTAAAVARNEDAAFRARAMTDNVLAQINLVSAAKDHGCHRFVFASTISVYGTFDGAHAPHKEDGPISPNSIYAWSKYVGECILEAACQPDSGLTGIYLRFAGIHGGDRRNGVIHNFIRQALDGRDLAVREPSTCMQPIFIEDAAAALVHAADHPLDSGARCYNAGGRDALTLRELAELVVSLTGSRSEIVAVEDAPARSQKMEIYRIRDELGFSPTGTAEFLSNTLKNYV